MSSSQRPARRKTRHTFDEEDEPVAKRSKVDNAVATNGTAKSATSKPNGAVKKRSKAAYDEDADGFQFTRKTRSTKAQPQPEPVVASSTATTTARTKRKKDSFLGSTPPEEEAGQRRRRSARLSDESHQSAPAAAPATTALKQKRKRKSDESKPAVKDREVSPELGASSLSVAKKRDGTKIALPFADTPVIRRNKEMREKGKSKHRRSSTGLRGRRASSLIDSGTSNGGRILRYTYSTKPFPRPLSASNSVPFSSFYSDVSALSSDKRSFVPEEDEPFANIEINDIAVPHADVSSRDFYKHIEQSLPEPRRMKQLITWNGTRCLPEKVNGGDASETFAVDGARHIMEELLKDWANKSEMSDWFNREDAAGSSATAIVKNPNPHNLRMAEKVKELEDDVKRLQDEKKTWENLRSSNSATGERSPSKALAEIDAEVLGPEQAAILATLQSTTKSDDSPADISTRLQAITQKLEPQIDLFADGIHKISQYRIAAERVADRILGATAAQLEKRDREAKEASGTAGVGAREILSALGGALSEQNR